MSYELRLEEMKKARITLGVIAINIIAFIVVNLIRGGKDLIYVAQLNIAITQEGEFWRLFTAMFFHANAEHLLANMLSLLFVGSFCELRYPKKMYYPITYILSGLIGNLFTLWFEGDFVLSLGASGAIAGLYGSMIIMMRKNSRRFHILSIIFLANFLINSFAPGIGTWAHIFGLLFGLLMGFYITRTDETREKSQRQAQVRYIRP